ncbi:hypothetical protein MRX96_001312 [Rhipicephalus microplus]
MKQAGNTTNERDSTVVIESVLYRDALANGNHTNSAATLPLAVSAPAPAEDLKRVVLAAVCGLTCWTLFHPTGFRDPRIMYCSCARSICYRNFGLALLSGATVGAN